MKIREVLTEGMDRTTTYKVLLAFVKFAAEHLELKSLPKFDFKFDSYNYNMGGPTDVSKIKTITEILDKHKSIAEVKMWDDRTDHIQIFNDWGRQQIKSGRLQDFHIEHVILENPHHK